MGWGKVQRRGTEDKCEARRENRWTEIDKCGFCRIYETEERRRDYMEERRKRMDRKMKYYCVQVASFYVYVCAHISREHSDSLASHLVNQ